MIRPHGKDCACQKCEHVKSVKRKNASAAERLSINLTGKRADRPIGSCIECKAPCYAGRAAPHRPDLPVYGWQYDPEKIDWGIEYASESRQSKCPRCRRKTCPGPAS